MSSSGRTASSSRTWSTEERDRWWDLVGILAVGAKRECDETNETRPGSAEVFGQESSKAHKEHCEVEPREWTSMKEEPSKIWTRISKVNSRRTGPCTPTVNQWSACPWQGPSTPRKLRYPYPSQGIPRTKRLQTTSPHFPLFPRIAISAETRNQGGRHELPGGGHPKPEHHCWVFKGSSLDWRNMAVRDNISSNASLESRAEWISSPDPVPRSSYHFRQALKLKLRETSKRGAAVTKRNMKTWGRKAALFSR
jgi:hypothetical protein